MNNMNIKSIAEDFAAENTGKILQSAIASAFADGYKQGYQDGLNARPIDDETTPKLPNFVDLGLPSGTLWADDFIRDEEGNIIYLPYVEAVKYGIPSVEQWKELEELSLIIQNKEGALMSITCISVNGNTINLDVAGYKTTINGSITWPHDVVFILDSINDTHQVDFVDVDTNETKVRTEFQGFRFPVLPVKNKNS